MLSFLASVVVISTSGVMMPGPALAVTIAKSYNSQTAGAQISLGHAIIEIPLMIFIYFGFAQFFQNTMVQFILSVLGGTMLIWLAISMFRAKTRIVEKGKDLPYNAIIAGIVTTALNPFFILWWAAVGSMLIMKSLEFDVTGFVLLITVHWLCDLVWLSFISVLIYRTKSLWGRRFQEWAFITSSLLLAGFGVWFMVSGILLIV